MNAVPEIRCKALNDADPSPRGRYVVYWMIAARRTRFNFALQRACEWARELGQPLLVLEALRCDYPWASDRLHRFVLDGMEDNARRLAETGVRYYPYVEPAPGAGRGLLRALAGGSSVVVTDLYPAFFLPSMVGAAARTLPVRLEAVDGNGLLPLEDADRAFPTAHGFRRHLQRRLPVHLKSFPVADPLRRPPPPFRARLSGLGRWPELKLRAGSVPRGFLEALPIDHAVAPAGRRGGSVAGEKRLARFLRQGLPGYAVQRNQPALDGTSRLSPYLHFGHVSSHEIVRRVLRHEGWAPDRLGARADGRREGWWGVGADAEAFLDQVVTWREVGFNTCWHRPDHLSYDSLPAWALRTLARHARDPRPERYTPGEMERAATADPIWNAAQRQLLREGHIHNYLRMLWGKKILEWSESPRAALRTMLELNDRYALDGRDPNSISGIFWILGRHDRAWGPERPIFGTVRYMSSASTARKLRLAGYLARYGPLSADA